NSRDKAEAIEAIRALGDIKTPGAVGLIVEKFQDPDPEISRAAAKALMNYGDTLYNCMNSENPDIRRSIVIAVGLLGKSESSAILLKGLEDSDPFIRVASLKSLEKIGDKKAVKKALKLLDDSSPNVRVASISYLIFCGNRSVVDNVAEKLSDENYIVRVAVLQAIAEFNARKYLQEVQSALKKDQPYARAVAAETLGKIGEDDKNTIKVLLNALSTDEAINVRLNSASSLRELTGNNFGYTKDALSSEKYEAVRKWKKWWYGKRR
ncbi:MAG: HEAT repeat domain-containing protein, partial [Candidatus Aureabacteria bacterium]|nr:HEAT repeat domain-containing protein [Candidatus Auribacterota bacterium]